MGVECNRQCPHELVLEDFKDRLEYEVLLIINSIALTESLATSSRGYPSPNIKYAYTNENERIGCFIQ